MTVRLLPTMFPHLETERLVLRQLTPTDAPAVFTIFGDAAVTRYYDLATFTGVEQAQQWIASTTERFQQGTSIRWAIVHKADGRVVGTCGYPLLHARNRRGMIGYDLARTAWRQGIASEAVRAVIRYGFGPLSLHRIEALVMRENIASVRVLEKLGFVEEGVLRDYGYWNGAFWDLRCFSLLVTDVPPS